MVLSGLAIPLQRLDSESPVTFAGRIYVFSSSLAHYVPVIANNKYCLYMKTHCIFRISFYFILHEPRYCDGRAHDIVTAHRLYFILQNVLVTPQD